MVVYFFFFYKAILKKKKSWSWLANMPTYQLVYLLAHDAALQICAGTVLTGLVQAHDVISQVGASCGGHDFDSSQVFADLDADLAHLQGELTGRHHDDGYGKKKYRSSLWLRWEYRQTDGRHITIANINHLNKPDRGQTGYLLRIKTEQERIECRTGGLHVRRWRSGGFVEEQSTNREAGESGRQNKTRSKYMPNIPSQCLTLYVVLFQVYSLQQRDKVCSALPGTILSPGQNVPSRQGDGNALLLRGINSLSLTLWQQCAALYWTKHRSDIVFVNIVMFCFPPHFNMLSHLFNF